MVIKNSKEILKKYEKYITRLFGTIGILVSAYFIISGVYFLSQNSTQSDSQDFFDTWRFRIEKDSRAIVLEPDGVNFGFVEAKGMNEIGILKVEAAGYDSSKPLFIGVGDTGDVRKYLEDIDHDRIIKLNLFPQGATYLGMEGTGTLPAPVSQDFWSTSQTGDMVQRIRWNPASEDASLVLMNADASPGITLDVSIKSQVGVMFIAGTGNVVIGGFLLLLSLFAVLYAGKTPNTYYPVPMGMLPSKKNRKVNKSTA